MICNCVACGDQFKAKPFVVARGGGLYCSMSCRLEFSGYRRLIEAVLPGTAKQLAERSGVNLEIVRVNVKRMLAADRWHIKEVIDTGIKGTSECRFEAVVALGHATNPDIPRNMRKAVTHHVELMILATMPAKLQNIAAVTDMLDSTVVRHIQNLRKRELCFVSGWVRAERGEPLEIFTAGEGRDVPCLLKPLTQVQKTARYLAKIKRDGRIEQKRAKGRADYWRKKALKRGDGMVGLFFGVRAPAKQEPENDVSRGS